MRCGSFLAAPMLVAALSSHAFAQTSSSEADALFTEAAALSQQGDYAQACAKYERSNTLDPAIGTEFNLADCVEHLGQRARAYRHFEHVAETAHLVGKTERETAARARADALRRQLAWVSVLVDEEDVGAVFTLDGAVLRVEPKRPLPLDPGPHRFEGTSRARARKWEYRFDAKPGAEANVRAFEGTPRAAAPVAPAAPPPSRLPRSLALVAGSLGVAALAVGGVAGILTLTLRSNASDLCPDPNGFGCSTDAGIDAWTKTRTAGDVSTVGFVAGGILVAGAVVLWIGAPKRSTRTAFVPGRWQF